MGAGAEARNCAKQALAMRIDRIALELPHMSAATLAFAVDDIRRTAANHDLQPLAALARALENAIAESHGAAMVLPYLEAMSDAAACESVDPAIAASLLASIGLRLHG